MTTLADLIDRAVTDAELDFTVDGTFAKRHGAALVRGVRRRRAGRALATSTTAAAAVGAVAWSATAVTPWREWLAPAGDNCEYPAIAVTETPNPGESVDFGVTSQGRVITSRYSGGSGYDISISIHEAQPQDGDENFTLHTNYPGLDSLILEIDVDVSDDLQTVSVSARTPDGDVPSDHIESSLDGATATVIIYGVHQQDQEVIALFQEPDGEISLNLRLVSGEPADIGATSVVCVTPEPSPASSPSPQPSATPSATPSVDPSPSLQPRATPAPSASVEPSPHASPLRDSTPGGETGVDPTD